MRLIVSDTSLPVIAGIAVGTGGGIGMARYLASHLFGVTPTDFWSFSGPIACILIAALAAVLPLAYRAVTVDPMVALRHE